MHELSLSMPILVIAMAMARPWPKPRPRFCDCPGQGHGSCKPPGGIGQHYFLTAISKRDPNETFGWLRLVEDLALRPGLRTGLNRSGAANAFSDFDKKRSCPLTDRKCKVIARAGSSSTRSCSALKSKLR